MNWTAGRLGTDFAIAFDGTGGVIVPDGPTLPAGGAPRTISAWVQNTGGEDAVLYSQGGGGDPDQTFNLIVSGTDLLLIFGPGELIDASGVMDSAWHFVKAVYDGTTAELFLDDVSVGSMAVALNTADEVRIGQDGDGSDSFAFSLQDWKVEG